MFKNSYPASSIARSSVCCSPCKNLQDGKDKLAGRTPTKGSNYRIFAPAATCAPTSAVAPIVALFIASCSADSSVVKYLEDDLQRIVKTIPEARPLPLPALASVPTLVVATAPHYKGPCKWPLKARFPDIYWDKTHLECYNFLQQCKDHFATAGATSLYRVLCAATFLKHIAMFRWQQHQHKIEDQTNISISWERFKAFLC